MPFRYVDPNPDIHCRRPNLQILPFIKADSPAPLPRHSHVAIVGDIQHRLSDFKGAKYDFMNALLPLDIVDPTMVWNSTHLS